MAIPNPKILDADLVELAAPLTFDGLPGARSNVETLHIVNNPGGAGAEPLRDHVLRVLERAPGEAVWQASGRPVVEGRRVEARIVSGVGGLDVEPTAWEPIGAGRPLEIPELANDQGIQLELSLVLPLDATAGQTELYFGLADQRATALERGHTEAAGDGIHLGLGDGHTTELLHGGKVTARDPADDQVDVSASGWIAAGEPFYLPASTVQLDGLDASGVPLTPGAAYWALLALDGSGALLQVKSDQATEPLPDALRPATSSGAVSLAMVQRDDSGVVTDGDIEPLASPAAAGWSAEGLTVSIGPSRALVDNRWVVHRVAESVSLPPNATVGVWRLPPGDLAIATDGARPDARAMLLHEAETDAGAVVVHRGRRRFLGRREVLRFVFPEALQVSTAAPSYASWPHEVPGRVAPVPGHLVAHLFDVAGTGGASEFEIEFLPEGGGPWLSLFPSGVRPSVPFDGQVDASTLPEVLTIPPRSLLRARLVGETTAARPSGAVVSFTVCY